MKTLNLQLFAKLNTDTSIVDYLKSVGVDSSYSNRSKLASQYGISNYTGTASQNTQLLNNMKKKASVESGKTVNGKGIASPLKQDTTPKATDTAPKNNAPADTTPAPSANAPYQTGDMPTYTAPTTEAEKATSIEERLPDNILATINSKPQFSEAYTKAMEFITNSQQKVNSGKTSYTDQLSQLIKDYQNREKFSYDASDDALFQQMLASSMTSGRTAMADSMGQAAALTGGYGSTYSQAVGNNVYNQYVKEAYDNLPQYYQMAFDKYNQEGRDMLNELSVISDADAREYDRLLNAYNANLSYAQTLYNQEYGAWQDSVNNAYKYADMVDSSYWSGLNYNENVRQYEQDFGYKQYQDELGVWFDKSEANRDQSNADRDYQFKVSESERLQGNWQDEFDENVRQFDINQDNWIALNDLNGDGVVDSKDYEYQIASSRGSSGGSSGGSGGGSNGSEEIVYDNLSTTEINAIKSAYKEAGGGEAGLTAVSQMLKAMGIHNVDAENLQAMLEGTDDDYTPPTDAIYDGAINAYAEGGEAGLRAFCDKYPGYDFNAIVDYAVKHGKVTNPSMKTYTRVDAMIYKDQYGNNYHIKDLPKEIRSKLEQMDIGKTYDFSTNKYVKEEEPKKPLIANALMNVTNGVMGHRVGSGGRIGVTNVLKD